MSALQVHYTAYRERWILNFYSILIKILFRMSNFQETPAMQTEKRIIRNIDKNIKLKYDNIYKSYKNIIWDIYGNWGKRKCQRKG